MIFYLQGAEYIHKKNIFQGSHAKIQRISCVLSGLAALAMHGELAPMQHAVSTQYPVAFDGWTNATKKGFIPWTFPLQMPYCQNGPNQQIQYSLNAYRQTRKTQCFTSVREKTTSSIKSYWPYNDTAHARTHTALNIYCNVARTHAHTHRHTWPWKNTLMSHASRDRRFVQSVKKFGRISWNIQPKRPPSPDRNEPFQYSFANGIAHWCKMKKLEILHIWYCEEQGMVVANMFVFTSFSRCCT